MLEQWSKVAGYAIVILLFLLLFGVFVVAIAVCAIVLCFVCAVLLVRSALEDFAQWEPLKPGISEQDLDSARSEIAASVEEGFLSAKEALEQTLTEWEGIVDRRVGINIFDGVDDIQAWPLNKWEVRRATGMAVEEYVELSAKPPHDAP